MTFGKFAEVYKQRHVLAKGLALSSTIDYRLKPLIERFGNRPVAEIKTADIDDFVADLMRPRVMNDLEGGRPTPASINRTLGLLRHMLNWAVGREYLDRTPFRRGTEVLIRMELEDNKRRRRIGESEEAALLAVASPHLQSMIIAARGHWHAPRRDAGVAVRRHRLDAADDHPQGCDNQDPTYTSGADRYRTAARRARMAPARQ